MQTSAERRRAARSVRRAAAVVAAVLGLAASAVLLAPGATAGDARPGATTGSVTVPLPDGLRPEGITSGPGTRYYVGSLADGRIVTGNLRHDGGSRVLLPGTTGRQVRGLYFDARTRLLWAVGNEGDAREPGTARVWAIDARTGAVVREWTIADALFLNDLVVTRTAVWITDSGVDRLTRIPLDRRGLPTGDDPGFLGLAGDWPATPEGGIGANGIRTLPDGDLLLDNSTSGGLWAVDRYSGEAVTIPVTGGPAIVSGDGLLRSGRTVYVVRGSDPAVVDVLRLGRSDGAWSATYRAALTDESLDVPSTATLAGGALWAVNARFGVASPDTASYWITRLPALR